MARTPATIDDRLTLYGTVPPKTRQRMLYAIAHGLATVRAKLETRVPARVRCWVLARIRHRLVSRGYTTKRRIDIGITWKYLRGRTFPQKLAGTVIHEYVHFLRLHAGRHTARTVLNVAIEEGIANTMQTRLFHAPEYLAIDTLDEAMVRLCWDKLANVLDQPARQYPQVEDNDVYREISYRLGYGIVRRFLRQHRTYSLKRLVRMSSATLARFAHETYGDTRRVSTSKKIMA